jgi:predicted patatin/cPLA2 family phospholipase
MPVRGVNGEAVIASIKQRALRRDVAGAAKDSRKLGLIVEGGGMRGVISAGALLGLEELGFTDVFDEVYGASAGAVNAAYFLAGQAAYGTTIYYQDINNLRFINGLRLRKVLDIDYLFDTVIPRVKPLNVERVLASQSQLFISIAEARTGDGFLGNASKSGVPLLTLLKASTAMPVIYNRMVNVNGRHCFDGGFVNPLPLREAIDNGCTDLLVLLTRPVSYVEGVPTLIERWLFDKAFARGNAFLSEIFLKGHSRANALRDLALGRRSLGVAVNIATICPDDQDIKIERMTKSCRRLKAAASESARKTLLAFGSSCGRIVEILRPFSA